MKIQNTAFALAFAGSIAVVNVSPAAAQYYCSPYVGGQCGRDLNEGLLANIGGRTGPGYPGYGYGYPGFGYRPGYAGYGYPGYGYGPAYAGYGYPGGYGFGGFGIAPMMAMMATQVVRFATFYHHEHYEHYEAREHHERARRSYVQRQFAAERGDPPPVERATNYNSISLPGINIVQQ